MCPSLVVATDDCMNFEMGHTVFENKLYFVLTGSHL